MLLTLCALAGAAERPSTVQAFVQVDDHVLVDQVVPFDADGVLYDERTGRYRVVIEGSVDDTLAETTIDLTTRVTRVGLFGRESLVAQPTVRTLTGVDALVVMQGGDAGDIEVRLTPTQ
jgi:hypothetical protein